VTAGERPGTTWNTAPASDYLLGVSIRRMDELVRTLGITGLSKSQVSVMAKDLDEQGPRVPGRPCPAAAWQRSRPLRREPHERDPHESAGWVKALLHSVDDQPDAEAVNAQFDRVL